MSQQKLWHVTENVSGRNGLIAHARHYSALRNVHYWKRERVREREREINSLWKNSNRIKETNKFIIAANLLTNSVSEWPYHWNKLRAKIILPLHNVQWTALRISQISQTYQVNLKKNFLLCDSLIAKFLKTLRVNFRNIILKFILTHFVRFYG